MLDDGFTEDAVDHGLASGAGQPSEAGQLRHQSLFIVTKHERAEPRYTTKPRKVLVLGATGTIGQATVRALLSHGYQVACMTRPSGAHQLHASDRGLQNEFGKVDVRIGDVTNTESLRADGLRGEHFDVLVSCLASRTGTPGDAWKIDYQAHMKALAAAKSAGVGHFVLLSAICVQKPRLAFQFAKLAFEKKLIESGMAYSIIRPTAYFKSLSGQIERVRQGKPFLLFGNGELTACKPISDADLGQFIAECLYKN